MVAYSVPNNCRRDRGAFLFAQCHFDGGILSLDRAAHRRSKRTRVWARLESCSTGSNTVEFRISSKLCLGRLDRFLTRLLIYRIRAPILRSLGFRLLASGKG
jgi:hypothetical protein